MRHLAAGLAFLMLAGQSAAAAEPPPELVEYTEEQTAFCRDLGGAPDIPSSYQTVRDLNGDGRDDFLTNLANLECEGAASAFCGSGGCPVKAWLSEPEGGYTRFDFGLLEGVRIEDASPLPRVLAGYHGTRCGDPDRIGADVCTRTWIFASNDPPEPPVDARGGEAATAEHPETPSASDGSEAADAQPETPATSEPATDASASEAAPDAAVSAPVVAAERVQAIAPGWTLREVPGSSPVALGGGAGSVAFLAAFCLGGEPFLAVTFHERPEPDAVTLGFDFSQGPLEATAAFEAGAGGAYVVPLAEGDLAARLGGRDRQVAFGVDGASEGVLSLSGSTRSIRGALETCR